MLDAVDHMVRYNNNNKYNNIIIMGVDKSN